jgi:hypothetical protein
LERTLDTLEDVHVKWAGEWKTRQESTSDGKKVFWWIRGFDDLLHSGILDE